MIVYRRPSEASATLAPGHRFGGGVIRSISLDENPYYVLIEVVETKKLEPIPDPRFDPRPWRP